MKPHRYGLSRVHHGLWVIWRDGAVFGTCLDAGDAFDVLSMLMEAA